MWNQSLKPCGAVPEALRCQSSAYSLTTPIAVEGRDVGSLCWCVWGECVMMMMMMMMVVCVCVFVGYVGSLSLCIGSD